MLKDPLIPAKAGTQADSPRRRERLARSQFSLGPRLRGDERLVGRWAVMMAMLATPALAHEGRHEALTLAEQARHLLTQPDHALAFAGLIVLAVIGRWHWRRATARK